MDTHHEFGYKLGEGPYPVGEVDRMVLQDEARGKELEFTLRFPIVAKNSTQRFPLVIFSHGMGGSRNAFPELTAHWASHGYVVAIPTHSDSVKLQKDSGRSMLRDPRGATRTVDLGDRLGDVSFLIDSILAITSREPGLAMPEGSGALSRIDETRIAVAGHSAGAMTAQLSIGVKARGFRMAQRAAELGQETGQQVGRAVTLRSVGDARIKAGVIISGAGLTHRAFAEGSWSEVNVPMLVITGSRDTSRASDETPESRQDAFRHSRGEAQGGPPAYLVFLEGATHSSYAGKQKPAIALLEGVAPPSDEELRVIVEATKSSTLAFLDAYIKDDAAALAYLRADDTLGRLGEGAVRFERK